MAPAKLTPRKSTSGKAPMNPLVPINVQVPMHEELLPQVQVPLLEDQVQVPMLDELPPPQAGADLRRKYTTWTNDEVTTLVEAVEAIGVGRWAEIKEHGFLLSERSAEDIRYKWSNLIVSVKLDPEKRRAELTPDLISKIKALDPRC